MGGEDPAVNAGNKYPMSMSVPKASPILIPSSQARNSSVCHPAIVMLALSLPFPSFPWPAIPTKESQGPITGRPTGYPNICPRRDHRPASARPPFLPPLHRNCDHENKVGDCVRGNLRERGRDRERGRKWSWLFTPFRSSRAKSNPHDLVNAGIISCVHYDLIRSCTIRPTSMQIVGVGLPGN